MVVITLGQEGPTVEINFDWENVAGFSIEGSTRRLIAAYFGIYSRLLCV